MQTISANLANALTLIDARINPRTTVDLFEFYDSDAVPGADGFDPADAIETFSSVEMTWNGIAYRRELRGEEQGGPRSDIVRSMGEKTNSVTLNFSNISRYMATLAQSQAIEGLILVIRCVVPSVTDDSLVLFVGRCDKPSDIDKQQFTLTARQDFGNINQTLPPRKFTADDPEGRLPGDDLYEGIPWNFTPGTYAYPFVQPSSGTIGRLLQRRETVRKSEQFSSAADTPFGSVIPEVLGRCQMELIPIIAVDKGIYIGAVWAACPGPIAAIKNVKTMQAGLSDPICTFTPTPAAIHLGDPGGTGTNLGNTCQADLGGGSKFSRLAYIDGAIVPTEYFSNPSLSDPNVLNELPPVTALILGRIVPLPDANGEYTQEGWSDNLVHLARFVLTDPAFVNINVAFMEDSVNYQTALHHDEPIIDDTESQSIIINTTDLPVAGDSFTRYRATGIYTPRYYLYNHLGDVTIIPEVVDGPYIGLDPVDPPTDIPCGIGFHRDESGVCVPDLTGPTTPVNASQPLLRKRYTGNVPITGEVRAVDFLYKTLFPAGKMFMRVNKRGKYEIRSEKPSDATRIRSAMAVNATSIPVYDVTPWKSGDLLIGRILLGNSLTNSEVRNVSSADYSTSGNSITLTAADTGGVTATASGATFSGGSTTVQASGTVTIGGTPAPGDTVTVTIDGVAIGYILGSDDTTGTTAAMLATYINATKRISYYIRAIWDSASPTVVTIKCLHGALNVDTALLKAHTGPIADPTTAPTIAAAGSGSLQAGTYLVAYSNQTLIGLTALTLFATVTLTANQKINVSSLPAFPAGVTGRQFFVSDAPNSSRLRYLTTRADAADFSIDSLPLPGAAVPPSHNSTSEELIRIAMSFATNSQDVFKPWSASTVLAIQGNLTDDTYLPTVPNGHKYQLTTAGTTGASEPTWPTGAGATVASGTAVFTEIGSTVLQQAGLDRANISKDTFRWPLGGQQSSVNQVKGSYRAANNDFALTPKVVNDPIHQAQVKKAFPLEFDGTAIDNYNQFFRIANWLLSKNREGDWFDSLETGPQGLVLEEGDVICASDDSGGLINVATRIEEIRIKPNHDVSIQRARKYSTAMFSDDVGSHSIAIPSTLKFVATKNSLAEFIDTPAIHAADIGRAGFFVSVGHDLAIDGDWRGFQVYADYGDGYVVVAQGDVAASIGATTSVLNDVADPEAFDTTNDVTFTLDFSNPVPTFQTCTQADLEANPYRNLFLIGDEYVQAATIVDNGNRSFTISDLFHARFETECADHSIGARVVYIDGAEVFVPTDPSRIGIEYNYKFVTTNQDVADATAVPFTWLGNILDPAKPTDLSAVKDSSGDWYSSTTGHPTEAERPESYNFRFRRADNGLFLRDVPVTPGIHMAAILQHIIHAAGGGNWSAGTYADITKNNVYGDADWSAAYVTQPTRLGGEINARVTLTPPPAPYLTGQVKLSFGPSDFTDPYGFITGVTIDNESNSTTVTRVNIYDWATAQQHLINVPTVDGVLFVRIVWSGTELRYQFSGSPIVVAATPVYILKDLPAPSAPNHLRIAVLNSGPTGTGACNVENIIMGGLSSPATIYSLVQQEEDNSGSGVAAGNLDVEVWQTSPITGIQGRSVRGVF